MEARGGNVLLEPMGHEPPDFTDVGREPGEATLPIA
jgi:hypothetical protein